MSSPAFQPRPRLPARFGRGIAEAAVERARLTVVPRRRTRAARVPFVMLVSLVLLGGVVGLLLFNTSMQQSAFAATALEAKASTLTAREQTLRMELDVLRNPQRVAEQAQQMGMVPAANPAFLSLPDGEILGTSVPANPTHRIRITERPPVKPPVLTPDPVVHEVAAAQAFDLEGGAESDRDGSADRDGRDRDDRRGR